MTIVDAQVHIWKADTPDRPWTPGRVPQLPEPFTLEKLLPMMNEAGVDRAVIVPPSWEGDRNDYGLEAVARYPGRFAVMGRVPLDKPEVAAQFADWTKQPGMVGIRVAFLGPTRPFITDGTADWFWPAAEKYALPVMFFGAPMSLLGAIAEHHPGLPLIADHMGLTLDMVKEGKAASGILETTALAKYPNVSVKLSATPHYSAEPYPFRDFNVHIRRLFDAFGPRRSYWGTDLTNSLAKATYRQRVTHFTEALDFLNAEDKKWIMGRAIMERLGWN